MSLGGATLVGRSGEEGRRWPCSRETEGGCHNAPLRLPEFSRGKNHDDQSPSDHGSGQGTELATGEAGCPPRGSSLCRLPRPRPRAPGSSSVQQGRHGPPGESERGTNSARSCRGTQWRSSVRFACVILRLSTIFFSLILKKKKIPSNVGVYVNSAFPFSHSLLSSTSSEGPIARPITSPGL